MRNPAGTGNVTFVDAALLARRFGASYAAAVRRLRYLNLVSIEHTQTLLGQTEAANRYLSAVSALSEDEAPVEEHRNHELHGQVLTLALEAWWRGEISQSRLLEVGRLLSIEDDTIFDLTD